MRILIVDDEEMIIEFLERALTYDGHIVDYAYDGAEGLEKALTKEYDVVVLDVLMPEKDGLSVCREIRERGIGVPIIILSSKQDTQDRILGLDSGADDYLTKPFTYEELTARLRALQRRPQIAVPVNQTFGNLSFDPARRVLSRNGDPLELTPREFAFMEYLFIHRNRAVSREELLGKIWGVVARNSSNRVDVCVRALREKLDDSTESHIQTVRGFGYMLRGLPE